MRTNQRSLLFLLVCLTGAAGLFGGCSTESDDGDGGNGSSCGGTCPVPASQVPATPVSFTTHLFADGDPTTSTPTGIIRRACNFTSCHGVLPATSSKADLYLGPPPGRDPMCAPGPGACTERADCACDPRSACNDPGECLEPTGQPSYCSCGEFDCAPGEVCVPGASPAANTALKQQILAGMVNVPSKTYPAMDLIEPGDPENSFLMLKIDDCQNCIGIETCATPNGHDCCTPQDSKSTACGDRMPQTDAELTQAEKDIIRKWIADGAQID